MLRSFLSLSSRFPHVPRLVYVESLADGDVVGEHLEACSSSIPERAENQRSQQFFTRTSALDPSRVQVIGTEVNTMHMAKDG